MGTKPSFMSVITTNNIFIYFWLNTNNTYMYILLYLSQKED